jgi:hypothetical protein
MRQEKRSGGYSGLTRHGDGRSSQIAAVEIGANGKPFHKRQKNQRKQLCKTPVRIRVRTYSCPTPNKHNKKPTNQSHVATVVPVSAKKLQLGIFHDSGPEKEVKASRAVRSSLDDLIMDNSKVYPGNKETQVWK